MTQPSSVPISGLQLAILVLATGYLGVPASMGIVSALGLPAGEVAYLSQLVTLSIETAAMLGVPVLRKRAGELLHARVPRERLPEVAAVAGVAMLAQFAWLGAFALDRWVDGGDAAVARISLPAGRGADAAFTPETLRVLAITCLFAPLVEELVFRGFLFGAWAKTRRPGVAMILSSAVFAMIHISFTVPFFMGLLLTALYLRTGALRAAILVHFLANAVNWNPVLGRFFVPSPNTGLASWPLQLTCLALVPSAIIGYALLAVRSSPAGSPLRPVAAPSS